MQNTKRSPIRVVVVDDSSTVRDLLVTILQAAEGIQVVGTGANGEEAVRLAKRMQPDVITMDVRMPRLDGLEATRRIMRDTPTPIIIVSGSLMHEDVELTFKALQAGALTVINKPGLADPVTCEKVVQTVRLMAGVPVIHHWGRAEGRPARLEAASPGRKHAGLAEGVAHNARSQSTIDYRKSDIKIVGIAASTGGPATLSAVLSPLPTSYPLPILVVQHITQGFVSGLADWLGTQLALRIGIAGHGETPQPGTLLLAPDDYHMQINPRGVIELSKAEPYKGLRPSANYLFNSLARAYGSRAAGVVLTGMGDDGAEGIQALHTAGGLTIAQDEESCVVYGMPHEAVLRNAIQQVLPPDQIALALEQMAQNGR